MHGGCLIEFYVTFYLGLGRKRGDGLFVPIDDFTLCVRLIEMINNARIKVGRPLVYENANHLALHIIVL